LALARLRGHLHEARRDGALLEGQVPVHRQVLRPRRERLPRPRGSGQHPRSPAEAELIMIEQIVFYSLSALVLLSALAVVLHRNTVHSSLFLGLSLAGVAGLFASLGADFLFAAQIMVYVSGIAVLVMFVVMLLGRASDLHLRQVNEFWMAALLICAIASAGLLR